ncbi:transposable element Tcb2 transposase [Trichonephila clavipes]|nr:transposable element Tcb2 transposase [Trichonephila clavipes]
MSSRHHIDDFMRGRIIGKIEEERKITDVAREFDIAHSVVSRLWKSFKTTGMCSRRHGEVVLEVRRLQKTDISSYQQKEQAHHSSAGGKSVSCCLRKADLPKNCCQTTVLPVSNGVLSITIGLNRTGHAYYSPDESRFSLSSNCRRQLIWRESGTAYRPENIQEKDRYPTCSIMVWAGIMINGRTRLHVVANGTMTSQRYIDEVLTSSYLNPIENVWDALGGKLLVETILRQTRTPSSVHSREEWDKLSQQLLDNVVKSMVRRVECCITLHGGHIPY